MSAMSALHAEYHELHDLAQPEPSREDMEGSPTGSLMGFCVGIKNIYSALAATSAMFDPSTQTADCVDPNPADLCEEEHPPGRQSHQDREGEPALAQTGGIFVLA